MKNMKIFFKALFIFLVVYLLGSIAIVAGTHALRTVQSEAIENITDSIKNSTPVGDGVPDGMSTDELQPDDSMLQTIIDQQTNIVKDAVKKQQDKLFVIMLVSATICLIFIGAITEDIRRSLQRISKRMRVLETGDFSEDISPAYIKRKDEFGDIARGMQELTTNMRNMITAIHEGAGSLTDIVRISTDSIDTVTSEVQGVNARLKNYLQVMKN